MCGCASPRLDGLPYPLYCQINDMLDSCGDLVQNPSIQDVLRVLAAIYMAETQCCQPCSPVRRCWCAHVHTRLSHLFHGLTKTQTREIANAGPNVLTLVYVRLRARATVHTVDTARSSRPQRGSIVVAML